MAYPLYGAYDASWVPPRPPPPPAPPPPPPPAPLPAAAQAILDMPPYDPSWVPPRPSPPAPEQVAPTPDFRDEFIERITGVLTSVSGPERITYEILLALQDLGVVFEQQYAHKEMQRLVKAPVRLDFYLPDLNLAIEIDGPLHRQKRSDETEAAFLRRQMLDKGKDWAAAKLGIDLIRIPVGNDWSKARLARQVGEAILKVAA